MTNKKTALITGASSGFGQATARLLAKQGWRVVLCARRIDRLEKLSQDLTQEFATESHYFQLDVTDRNAVLAAIEALPEEWKAIDLLVNNAGLALGLDKAHQANLDDWDTMVDTNIKGLTYVTRAVLPLMVERNQGHVVNIGSIAGNWPYPGGNAYGATKAFVRQFSLNLRADLLGTRVRVTNIEPGLAETEFSLVRFKGDSNKADNVYQQVEPLIGDDIAEAVVWCANQPAHVNINSIEVMPTCQSFGPLAVAKDL
jgi:3-hydroxy acid dehydrogenase / malonic semialdehyde reductase